MNVETQQLGGRAIDPVVLDGNRPTVVVTGGSSGPHIGGFSLETRGSSATFGRGRAPLRGGLAVVAQCPSGKEESQELTPTRGRSSWDEPTQAADVVLMNAADGLCCGARYADVSGPRPWSGKENGMDCSDFIAFLYTVDLEQADAFYRGKLRLPLVADQGTCRIYRICQHACLGLCRARPGREPSARGAIITFVTDDVEGRYAELRNRGVAFESAPAFNPDYNITHCFLRDPDGHLLEIQRFEDPKWRRTGG